MQIAIGLGVGGAGFYTEPQQRARNVRHTIIPSILSSRREPIRSKRQSVRALSLPSLGLCEHTLAQRMCRIFHASSTEPFFLVSADCYHTFADGMQAQRYYTCVQLERWAFAFGANVILCRLAEHTNRERSARAPCATTETDGDIDNGDNDVSTPSI